MFRSQILFIVTALSLLKCVALQNPQSKCVQGGNCMIPKCRCSSTKEPVFADNNVAPQIISLVFEGSVNDNNFDKLASLFQSSKPAGDIAIGGTIFVKEQGSNFTQVQKLHYVHNYEIGVLGTKDSALNGPNQGPNESWRRALKDHKLSISFKSKIPLHNIIGYRNDKRYTEEHMYKSLNQEGFQYDSSGIIKSNKLFGNIDQWPFSLDFGWDKKCELYHCPSESYPNLWEIPRIMFYNTFTNQDCLYVSECPNLKNKLDIAQALADNFLSAYRGPRTPFVINVNIDDIQSFYSFYDGLKIFIDGLVNNQEVLIIPLRDLVLWLKHPTPVQYINLLSSWMMKYAKFENPLGTIIKHPVSHVQENYPRPQKPNIKISEEKRVLSKKVLNIVFEMLMQKIKLLREDLVNVRISKTAVDEYDRLLKQISLARAALRQLNVLFESTSLAALAYTFPEPVSNQFVTTRNFSNTLQKIKETRVFLPKINDMDTLNQTLKYYVMLLEQLQFAKTLAYQLQSPRNNTLFSVTDEERMLLEKFTKTLNSTESSRKTIAKSVYKGLNPMLEMLYNQLVERLTKSRAALKSFYNNLRYDQTGFNKNSTRHFSLNNLRDATSDKISRLEALLLATSNNPKQYNQLRILLEEFLIRFKTKFRQKFQISHSDVASLHAHHVTKFPEAKSDLSNVHDQHRLRKKFHQSKSRQSEIELEILKRRLHSKHSLHMHKQKSNVRYLDKYSRTKQNSMRLDNTAWRHGSPYARKNAPRLPSYHSEPSETACQGCCLPYCRSYYLGVPKSVIPSKTPQMVVFMFQGPLDKQMYSHISDLFSQRPPNPNGCRISMTYFASHVRTDYSLAKNLYDQGMEIAINTMSATSQNRSYWSKISYGKLRKEIVSMKENLVTKSGVKPGDIVGFRIPHFHPVGEKQYEILKELGFLYDSSLLMERRTVNVGGVWPFTLHNGWPIDCMRKPCPGLSYPGLWEIPVMSYIDTFAKNTLFKNNKNTIKQCLLVDSCNPRDLEKYLNTHFLMHYKGERVPLYLNFHGHNLKDQGYRAKVKSFITTMQKNSDVYIVSARDSIEWMKYPKALNDISNTRWAC